ncbi:NADH-quinone oxidoreductase subunit NuoN [Roseococcus thiosulfatophilus]|uniref:NADH-quinone oxidoreductase subunit NuoN n=1 Tax=Roseococcus thiosulfatophilus TaxID=35813 RepID=UPI001A8D8CBC|nr:NADH-quinone oxidoreductase subunit NuoN [Roseococcus thiosulfatophilus]
MNWTLALPELVLALSGLAILVAGVLPRRDMTFPCTMMVLGAFLLSGAFVLTQPDGMGFGGQYISDAFARFMKVLVLAGAALALLLALDWNRAEGLSRFEYPVLVLFATLGMMVMISANDLMSLYLGLELLSLPLYVMAAFHRDNARSSEAGLKYFVLGALSSGLMLYGMSLVYGFAGTTNFAQLAQVLGGTAPISAGVVVGIVFIITGLCFKVAAVPFHMWTPDVYEGAPTSVVAYFATATKVGAIAAIVRVLAGPFGGAVDQWQQVIVLASIASMILGAFAAIGQTNIKRLMAYSWISHTGFVLMGLAVGTEAGLRGVLIYTPIYLMMSLGAFSVLVAMRRNGHAVENIQDLAGLGRTDPAMALGMAIFMFAMAGIPPLSGFFAKLYVLLPAVEAGFWLMAVVAVLSSVVSAYYYLRVVKVMYFDASTGALDARPSGVSFVLAGTGLFTMFFFLMPAPLLAAARQAVAALIG